MKDRSLKSIGTLILKGVAMGAADVVPGVSGGTIAFIVGIYEELVESIKSINIASLKMLFTGKLREFWSTINGTFLLSIMLGISISIFSLAKLITMLLTDHPIMVWSYFFGLVLASTLFVAQSITKWNLKTGFFFVLGGLIALYITIATPAATPDALWFIFLCGAIAICAMILPGISGSFILVLLGKYFFIMQAVKSFDLTIILVFIAGAAIGITSFSRLLSYALKRHHNTTIALLSGFMLGSLNKVWPWKEVLETYIDSHGVTRPLIESNIWPNQQIPQAVILAIIGFLTVYTLEKISSKGKNKKLN